MQQEVRVNPQEEEGEKVLARVIPLKHHHHLEKLEEQILNLELRKEVEEEVKMEKEEEEILKEEEVEEEEEEVEKPNLQKTQNRKEPNRDQPSLRESEVIFLKC